VPLQFACLFCSCSLRLHSTYSSYTTSSPSISLSQTASCSCCFKCSAPEGLRERAHTKYVQSTLHVHKCLLHSLLFKTVCTVYFSSSFSFHFFPTISIRLSISLPALCLSLRRLTLSHHPLPPQDAFMAIGFMAGKLSEGIARYMPFLQPALIMGLKNIEEYQVRTCRLLLVGFGC
jgi:hypothetical protein